MSVRTKDLQWRSNRFYVSGRSTHFSVVQDSKYPAMWRVCAPDGTLSDMVNKARAKDAALSYFDRVDDPR